jgi:hypothetical protein
MDEQRRDNPPEIIVLPAAAITARNDRLDDALADLLLELVEREATASRRESEGEIRC